MDGIWINTAGVTGAGTYLNKATTTVAKASDEISRAYGRMDLRIQKNSSVDRSVTLTLTYLDNAKKKITLIASSVRDFMDAYEQTETKSSKQAKGMQSIRQITGIATGSFVVSNAAAFKDAASILKIANLSENLQSSASNSELNVCWLQQPELSKPPVKMTQEDYRKRAATDYEPPFSDASAWENWGKKAGTITALEYAYLSDMSYVVDGNGDYKKRVVQYLQNIEGLPEGHPFKSISEDNILIYSREPQAVLIAIDSENAIVVFQGTTSEHDVGTDIDLWADESIFDWLTGNDAAERMRDDAYKLIEAAEKKGFKNIQVTGHSLGGYLAGYVASKSTAVSECLTLDAPGFQSDIRDTAVPNSSEKIHNIINKGSVVNTPGTHIGETIKIELDERINNDAGDAIIFPNHSSQGIIYALGGKYNRKTMTPNWSMLKVAVEERPEWRTIVLGQAGSEKIESLIKDTMAYYEFEDQYEEFLKHFPEYKRMMDSYKRYGN